MKNKVLRSALALLSLPLLVSIAPAEVPKAAHFSGVLNDYSPSNVSGGPWEMHGQWSMDVHVGQDTANFYADMTMSDYVISGGVADPTQAGQNPHTHHIKLTNVQVIGNMAGCPTFSPVTTLGFQMSGTVSLITGNGGMAPFETTPPSSILQVCVTGGVDVPFSNMTMVFTGPATKHFGTQAIHGVVRKTELIEKH